MKDIIKDIIKRTGMMRAKAAAAFTSCAIMAAMPQGLLAQSSQTPAPGDAVLTRVMWVVLAGWIGIGIYLFIIDRRVSRLEKRARND